MFASSGSSACCQCGKYSRKSEMIVVRKIGEDLKQWMEQYNLNLILKKREQNYICKSHFHEESSEKVSFKCIFE